MKKFPKLYKKNTNDSIQVWWMELDGNKFRTNSSKLDGQVVTSEWTTCEGKNIGKKNETTPEQQAKFEVEREYSKKKEIKGYVESLDDAQENDRIFKPMLANIYEDYLDHVEKHLKAGEIFSQPKLDGIRCIATKDGLSTRNGKPIVSCDHIMRALKPIFDLHPSLVLDGELYNQELKEDFNKICSLVRKLKPEPSDLEETSRLVQYHVYDMVNGSNFELRNNGLKLYGLEKLKPVIQLLPTTKCKSKDHIDELYQSYLEQGYEGQIIRISHDKYEQKRTKNLLKRKTFVDDEFPIVDIVEGIGNRSGMAGYITYRLPNGRTFDSGIRGNFDYYKEILKNKKKYKTGTVRFFGYTPDEIPRFPVTVALFEGKRDV